MVFITITLSSAFIYILLKNRKLIRSLESKQGIYADAMNGIIKTIAGSSDEAYIFQSMADILGKTLGADRALIYDVDLHTFFATALCEWKKEGIESTKASYSLAIFRSILEYFLLEKKWFISHKNEVNPLLIRDNAAGLIHTKMKINSLIWYPFFFQSDKFYILIFNNVLSRKEWTMDEIKFLENASNQVIVAFQKTKLINEIAEREKKLIWEQNLSNSGPVVIFRFLIRDRDWPMEYVSRNIESEFGYKAEDFIDGNFSLGDIMVKEDLFRITKNTWSNIKNPAKDTFEHEYRILDKSGNVRWVYAFNRIIRNNNGRATHFHGYVYDITKKKLAEDLLAQEKEKLQVTLHSIGEAVITTDIAGIIDFMNPIAEILTGWQRGSAMGLPVSTVLILKNEITGELLNNSVESCLQTGRMSGLDSNTLLVKKNGSEIPISDSVAPIKNHSGKIIGAIIVFHDVIQAKELEWHSTHDPLTGMLNRKEFEKRIEEGLEAVHNQKIEKALLYIDLDQFKIINDTCGHAAGDLLLQKLSAQMNDLIDSSDVAARLGGDEFGILLHDSNLEKAIATAEKIRSVIKSAKFKWENKKHDISASIGIVPINSLSTNLSEILSAADIACFTAKDHGRNRVHVFDNNDEYMIQKHGEMHWVSRINHAFEQNRFVLMKQTIQAAAGPGNQGNHFEILLRMKDDNGGLITPDNFIPAAERYNLMYDIDKWVINAVFSFRHANKTAAAGNLYCINLSGKTLSETGLLEFILSQVALFQINPAEFCFEITETSAIANFTRTRFLMTELKKKGFLFALDDFGTGSSSFSYLKNLSVDFIKIDGSFIRDMLTDQKDLAMVQSINEMGHIMNLKTIAEFAESAELVDKLAEIGVDYIQGYAIDRPGLLHTAAAV